jgi:hypothetical protein
VHRQGNTSRGRSGELFSAVVDSLIDAGLSVRFRAGGGSMSPTIADGEYLIVAPVDAARVSVGDIIFCQMRRGPVAHRVWAIDAGPDNERRFVLFGDASLDGDLPATGRQLRGQVVGVERDGARLDLKIFGGLLGRVAFMFALQLRRSLRVARACLGVPSIPAALPR